MNVPEDLWVTSLVHVFGNDDLARDWVHSNIIGAKCNWSEAKTLFTDTFNHLITISNCNATGMQ